MGVNGIYGLSGSGLDIESMVKVGMMSKQSQYDKMQQTYTKNEWKKAEYIDTYSTIQTFNNSTLSQYKMSSSMNAREASTTSTAIKVTANASAPLMNHKVEVTEMSSSAYLLGQNSLSRIYTGEDELGSTYTATSSSIKLRDVLFSGMTSDGTTVTGTNLNGDSISANLKDTAFSFVVSDGKSDLSESARTVSFTYADLLGDKDNEGFTFNDLVSKINGLSTNVRASYDSVNDKFSLYSKEGGSENTISLSISANDGTNQLGSTTAAFFNGLGLMQSRDGSIYTGSDYAYDSVEQSYTKTTGGVTSSYVYDSDADTYTQYTNGSASATYSKATVNGTTGYYDSSALSSAENNSITVDSATSITVNGVSYAIQANDVYKNSDSSVVYKYDITQDAYVNKDDSSDVKTADELANDSDFTHSGRLAFRNGNTEYQYDITNKVFTEKTSTDGSSYTATGNTFSSATVNGKTAFYNTSDITDLANSTLDTSFKDGLTFSAGNTSTAAGTDGNIKVDGVNYTTTDNKVTVNGMTFTALEKTSSPAIVSVTQDTDGIIEKVKSFVEDYNKLLSGLYEKYDEKPNSDYKPLTQTQKDNMKEDQIEKWEEKAKAGMLYHDQTLYKIINKLRDAVSTPIDSIDGKYNSAYNIGISTTGTKGQLTLDEDKLKAALADDPDSVYQVFAKLDANDDADGNGIAQRIGDVLNDSMKLLRDRAGTSSDTTDDSDLSVLMRELQTKMSNFKKMMNSFEDALYKKYDAMEVALSKLGVQLNYITGGQ